MPGTPSPQYVFEPKILAFLCNWCGYAGADLAGVSRIQYVTNIRTIRVMCSGRIDARFIIEAFIRKMDGVLVVGCHLGDCHYISGNYEAHKNIHITKISLKNAGVNPERLRFEYISAAEGARFAEVVNSFSKTLTQLGPLEVKGGDQKELKLKAARRAFEKEGLNWIVGKQTEFMEKGNIYGEIFTQHEIDRLLENAVCEATKENEVLVALAEESPISVKEISQRAGMFPSDVLKYIFLLKKKGLVYMKEIKGKTPLYALEDNG